MPIFEHGNVLLFEPVVNIYPYNSTVLPGDVVFCQPRDDGPCHVCILGDMTVPPKVGDGSAAPALRVGDNSAASALRVGDESVASRPRVKDESAASAPRAGDESTAAASRAEMLWDIYNGDDICFGSCTGDRIYGRLKMVRNPNTNIWSVRF